MQAGEEMTTALRAIAGTAAMSGAGFMSEISSLMSLVRVKLRPRTLIVSLLVVLAALR